jgi:hypothetical protein
MAEKIVDLPDWGRPMRPSFIGSSPFQEESSENYTIGRLHFPEDSDVETGLEKLEFLFFLDYKVHLERRYSLL